MNGVRCLVALGAMTLLLTAGGAAGASAPTGYTPPPIQHVWVIELENEGYAQSFGTPSNDPYLATTLVSMGALLKNYFAVGHNSLDNYVAQVTGQAPDRATDADCPVWTPFEPTDKVRLPFDQQVGNGCVYPASIPTLGNQLTGASLTWKAYLQDMGNDPARDHTVSTPEGPACGHPAVGKPDLTEGAEPQDQFADRHEGFMYFQSVTDNAAYCDAHVLSFQPLLSDLSSAATTPDFSWISPNLCNDGHDAPCANGDPGGFVNIDAFLSTWVPIIMASPAYKTGVIMITFDEGNSDNACCGEVEGRSDAHPNTGQPGIGGPGGGRVGAVLLSPYITPGTVSTVDYNHYAMLKSIEDIFGLSHLGDAQMPQVQSFGSDVYTNP